MRRFFLQGIRIYRLFFSPWFGGQCRFYPSCSEYASRAIAKYSWWKALGLSGTRILKCHPWHPGGIDHP